MVDKKFYNCVLSQIFSPCGELLVCGNSYGDIVVFEVSNILGNDDYDGGPKCRFTSPKKEQICSITSTNKFCITGTVGNIYGWDWESIKSGSPKLSWTISLPMSSDALQKIDINSLFVKEGNDSSSLLYIGSGDNKIYVYSLEDGKYVRSFEGHEDYIHSIYSLDWQMTSASEDGTVRFWDLRQNSMTNLIQPFKEHKVSRPHLGKWIGDVSFTNDWLVCGGGPRLSLWHMRTLDMMTTFTEMTDSGIHVAHLHGDCILAGGNDKHFYHLSFTGDILSKIDISPCAVYSAVYTDKPYEMLSLAGSSTHLDICTNFTFRHKVLSFFG